MSQINILTKNSRLNLFFATMLALLGIFASVFFISNQQVNAQAATTYTWKDRQLISVTGGNVKAGQSVKVDANDAAPLKGAGRILTSEEVTGRVCGGLFGWFCEDKTVTNDCYVDIRLTFDGPSKAIIASKKSTIPGAGTPNGPVDCTQVSSYDAYNGKTISIGGTRPGDADTTNETGSQKTVQFKLTTSLTNDKAPAVIKLGVGGQTLTANKYELNGDISYSTSTQLSPGNYSVCLKEGEGIVVECTPFTKVKFQFLTVNIGNSEGAGSRTIEVEVKVSTTGGMGVSNIGPLKLVLYNSAGAEVKSVNTNQVVIEDASQSNAKIYYVRANMQDVEAGQYKICVGAGQDTCQDIIKERGSVKKVKFEITGQQALDLAKLGGETEKTSCAVEGIGWIVCPLAGFLGMMTDGLFAVLTTLLSFTPVQSSGATYDTWQAMRNIANAAFVIAFLMIIFSQLTSFGINNYGVKKMIPRLIVAAILVNVSFPICAIAVDLSNILGYSLQSLMTNAAKTASNSSNNLDVWGDLVAWIIAGGAGGLAVGGTALTIASAGGWIPALALLLPVLVTVLFAVITVVLVLAARQALIIILIVISPLAFVAYILPNTEDWFHKWRKLFMTLLIMFPVISVIFGGSQLAAAVIRAGTNNPLIYILSLAVQVIPFFLVPIIMKTAGGLLNRFGGIVNNPNKGPFDKLRKSAQNYGDMQKSRGRAAQVERYNKTGKGGAVTRWQMRRKTEQAGVENVLKKAEAGYVAKEIKDSEEFRNKAAGGSGRNPASSTAQDAVLANAVSALDKIEDEEASNAEKLMRHGKDPNKMMEVATEELITAIKNDDVTKGLAAQRILRNSGNKGLDALHNTLEKNVTTPQQKTSNVVRNLRSDINSAGLKGRNNVLTSWAYGADTQTLADAKNDPSALNGLTDTELAGQSLEKALKDAPQGAITQAKAQSIIDNQNIWKDIDENKKVFFEQIAGRPSIHRQVTPTPSSATAAPGGFEQTDSGLFIPRDRG